MLASLSLTDNLDYKYSFVIFSYNSKIKNKLVYYCPGDKHYLSTITLSSFPLSYTLAHEGNGYKVKSS